MATPTLSIPRAAALYVGALLGPSLLLLPGLAARLAGPASILAWAGLLALSGLLAWVFTALGTRIPAGGVTAYVTAGIGAGAGRAVGWCFQAGVVFGAPVVCLIGGTYVAALVGGGEATGVGCAVGLLAVVVVTTLGGARVGTTVQSVLVAVLMALVAVAVVGAAPGARAAHWTPFAPHGWLSIGSACSVLMLSFVGWEAIAPLTARLRDPRRQLPRVIGIAFAVTATVYLALAGMTIAVLGDRAGGDVPLADLLRVAVGSAGPVIAAVAAVALTLAATNAYISGAKAMAGRGIQVAIGVAGVLVLGGAAGGVVTTAELVAVPTTLFVTVYLGATAAAVRLLRGPVRVAAAVSCAVVIGVLAFSGWALAVAAAVVIASLVWARLRRSTAIGTSDVLVLSGDHADLHPAR